MRIIITTGATPRDAAFHQIAWNVILHHVAHSAYELPDDFRRLVCEEACLQKDAPFEAVEVVQVDVIALPLKEVEMRIVREPIKFLPIAARHGALAMLADIVRIVIVLAQHLPMLVAIPQAAFDAS